MTNMGILLAIIVGAAAVWALVMGALVWRDARALAVPPRDRWPLVLEGVVRPWRYWYLIRPSRMSPAARQEWLAAQARRLGLPHVRTAYCPLCGGEIADAWRTRPDGRLTTAPGPVRCPRCDFRLDACRHCAYFQPAGATTGSPWNIGEIAWTHGRCILYKSLQPVEAITNREMARRLRERGYDHLRAATPIADSYIPLAECRGFVLEPRHLKHSGMQRPGLRQRLAIQVETMDQTKEEAAEPPPSDDEAQWLL